MPPGRWKFDNRSVFRDDGIEQREVGDSREIADLPARDEEYANARGSRRAKRLDHAGRECAVQGQCAVVIQRECRKLHGSTDCGSGLHALTGRQPIKG